MRLIRILWHLGHTNDEKHDQNDDADGQIRSDKDGQIGITDCFKLSLTKLGTLGRIHRMKLVLNEIHSDKHPHQRTDGIECLG